jgi:hypothetical protein
MTDTSRHRDERSRSADIEEEVPIEVGAGGGTCSTTTMETFRTI